MVCKTTGNIEQFCFPCGAMVSYGSFKKMAGAVQFVSHRQLLPFFLGFHHLKIGIEVAVFLLGSRQQINGFIRHGFELWIGKID